MKLRLMITAVATLALVALAAAACGDDDDNGGRLSQTLSPTSSEQATATATASVEEAVDEVFAAIRDRQQDRLRDLSGTGLRDRAQNQDFQRLAECVPAGAEMTLVSKVVEIEGSTATVTVTFEVTQDGGTSTVERVWTFEQQADGSWLLIEFPECPFATS